jgi:hypothetical protein
MDYKTKVNELWDYLENTETATKEEICLVTSINGTNLESLESILYSRTGWRSLEQILQMEDK